MANVSPIIVEPPVLDSVPRARLNEMRAAGKRVKECEETLATNESNVVRELIDGADTFYQWDHYPPGDVYDWASHSQYFYHAHDPRERQDLYGDEHGHFHTFLRPRGFPDGVTPAPLPDLEPAENNNDQLSHLVAVSMDITAQPQKLFTTNRWVTGEVWYSAADVKALLPRFSVKPGPPSWPVNAWLTNILVLFGPTIEALIDARDALMEDARGKTRAGNIYENRDIEVTSVAKISVEEQLRNIEASLA